MADLDAEREVVLEEVALYEDSPSDLIHDYLAETVFWEHPLGRQIIGTAETLRALDRRGRRRLSRRALREPRRSSSPPAGNLRHERIVELARRHFGAGAVAAAPPAPACARPGARHDAYFMHKDTEQFHVCLGAPSHVARRPAALRACRCSTRPWAARRARACSRRSARSAAWSTRCTPTPRSMPTPASWRSRSARDPRACAEVMELCTTELERLPTSLTDEEVERTKEQIKGQIVLSMESPSAAHEPPGAQRAHGLEIRTLDGMLAQIDAVDADAVVALAREFYDVGHLVGGVHRSRARAVQGDRRRLQMVGPRVTGVVVIGALRAHGLAAVRHDRGARPTSRSSPGSIPQRAGREAARPVRRRGRVGAALRHARRGAGGRAARRRRRFHRAGRRVRQRRRRAEGRAAHGRRHDRPLRRRRSRACRPLAAAHERGPARSCRTSPWAPCCSCSFAARAARYFPSAEIIELHEQGKARRAVGHLACCTARLMARGRRRPSARRRRDASFARPRRPTACASTACACPASSPIRRSSSAAWGRPSPSATTRCRASRSWPARCLPSGACRRSHGHDRRASRTCCDDA